MRTGIKLTLLFLLLGVGIAAVASQFITVRQVGWHHRSHTTNAGEITGDVLVGQTFVAERDDLSGVAVMFATYSGRNNTQPVEFHLRESVTATEDLRAVQVLPDQLGDNQLYQFAFEPIPDSRGKTFFFYVTSPTSQPGDAVTVDLDTRDPYHLGTAYLARDIAVAQGYDPAAVAQAGKQTIDVVFESYYSVPLHTAVVTGARRTTQQFVAAWPTQRGHYIVWLRVVLSVVLLGIFVWTILAEPVALRKRVGDKWWPVLWLSLFGIAGLLMRMWYASELPLTNDEGNYLYDARQLREGILAGGDGYVKAPLVIAWIAVWQLLFGDTIMAGRMSSVFIGTLTLLPIYWIGASLRTQKAGLVAAALWTLLGAPVVFSIYVHTQPLALFFAVAGVAVTCLAIRRDHYTGRLLLLAGVLFGLGVASRKSVLAVGLVPLLLVLAQRAPWSQRIRQVMTIGVGFAVVLALLLGWAFLLYGEQGVIEVLGISSAEDGLRELEPVEIEQARAYSLRGMTPFFRESLPLILLAVLGWGWMLEGWLRRVLNRLVVQRATTWFYAVEYFLPRVGWFAPLLTFLWAFDFFFEYEGSAFMIMGIPALWYVMGAWVILSMLWPVAANRGTFAAVVASMKSNTSPHLPPNVPARAPAESVADTRPEDAQLHWLRAAGLAPVWIGGLVFLYQNWIKFHANYIGEFLPPLVVMGGIGLSTAYYRFGQWRSDARWLKRLVTYSVVFLFTLTWMWAATVSTYITFFYEHTGTFHQAAVKEAAQWARDNIPYDQAIFTGAAAIPYLSGHHTALDIAHPRWYAYEFTRTDPERLNTFLPPIEEMLAAYRESEWFLLEGQTGFSFLMEYSEIEAGLETDWENVKGIPNGDNTLTFYRRK